MTNKSQNELIVLEHISGRITATSGELQVNTFENDKLRNFLSSDVTTNENILLKRAFSLKRSHKEPVMDPFAVFKY